MCGITGIVHFDPSRTADRMLLGKMADTIRHRGPDGEGYYCNQNVGLGHRRLSIIDLKTGDQPMFSEDKSLCIVYNGEIYNYIELREELKKLGYAFHTDSDTEVILTSYRQWGLDCQQKFNGMWAFALWDDSRKRLFVSRDRVGEKPLHYSLFDNSFVFGSEIKCLLAYGVDPAPNMDVLELYLSLGYVPAPYSFYKHVRKLLPGHYLLVENGGIKEYKYWDLPAISDEDMITDKKRVYETFSSLFHDAVKIRMRSDVPYGAFLSGGLDSSSVVAVMSEISKHPVKTFTIGFENKAFDERKLAKEVALKFRTEHHAYCVEPEQFETSLEKVLHHADEPFGDSSAIPTGSVSRFAGQQVKMVLTGDGGDEVLSGYNMYQAEKFAGQYRQIPLALRMGFSAAIGGFASLTKGNIRYHLNKIRKLAILSNLPFDKRLMAKYSWISPAEMKEILAGNRTCIQLEDYVHSAMKNCISIDPFYRLMYFHFKISLPYDMLTKVDLMSMANSLETRLPFLDYRLVEYMCGVSKKVKMKGYERKSVLRNTIGRQLPPSLLNASKKGFAVPLREWFKEESFEEKLRTLSTDDFGLNSSLIKKIIAENKEGKSDSGNFIWMLFVLKKWLHSGLK